MHREPLVRPAQAARVSYPQSRCVVCVWNHAPSLCIHMTTIALPPHRMHLFSLWEVYQHMDRS